MKGHAEKLKENLNYALKDTNDEKLDRKEEKDQVIDSQERMVKKILKLATLKTSSCFNMQQLREEHDKALNNAKENGTTETIEELDKLRQIMGGKM